MSDYEARGNSIYRKSTGEHIKTCFSRGGLAAALRRLEANDPAPKVNSVAGRQGGYTMYESEEGSGNYNTQIWDHS